MRWHVRAGARARRRLLGLLVRLAGSGGSDVSALLARFPDEALMPLRRSGLDPVPELGALRAGQPVSRLKLPLGFRGWLVTGYDQARAVLADHRSFSNDFANVVGRTGITADQDPGGLGVCDPPRHTELRRMLTGQFTARALQKREAQVRRVIDEALDAVAAASADGRTVDLHREFSVGVPFRVIAEMLGLDAADRDAFEPLSTARFDVGDGAQAQLAVMQDSIGLLTTIVARYRTDPVPGLIADILAGHGDEIGDIELAGVIDGLITGGLETTASMLSLGTLALLQHPHLADALRADDAAAAPFVEETLRHLTVVQVGFPRFARRDLVLDGHDVLEGDVVICSLSGADRDPGHVTDPDRIDPSRPASGHLAFGHGQHRCVGAELARLELRLAYPALARRFPRMQLAVGADELRYHDVSIVYGVKELPVRLGATAS